MIIADMWNSLMRLFLQMYDVVIGGLLYGVLLDPLNASKVRNAFSFIFCVISFISSVHIILVRGEGMNP